MSTTSPVSDPDRADIDAAISELATGARVWARLSLTQRATLFTRLRVTVGAAAEQWATTSCEIKGIPEASPLRGEEWLTGPYITLQALSAYIDTLQTLARGENPLDGVATDTAPGDRVRVHAFPAKGMDRVVLSGFTGEVWLQPGVSLADARDGAGLAERHPEQEHGVGLVLGAGNVTSIPILDTVYELIAKGRVVLLKLNPTQDGLADIFARALAPLIEPGFVRIVQGGGDVGAYLTEHPFISHVHITGSATTFDAIVWGPDKNNREAPVLDKPITAELGGVSPIIVVPGSWSAADLAFHAEHIATMRLNNGGHNCIAGQVVILSRDWPQREEFVQALRTAYENAPARTPWYPHTERKLAAARHDYPGAAWCDDGNRALIQISADDPADASRALETTEYFSPVLGLVELEGNAPEFFDAAIAYANDKLTGTLGANILIDPATQASFGDGFDLALADLHYGGIAVNAWTGVVFATAALSWGAYPGGTLKDVGSGIDVVHNALLLPHVERSILRGPFRPFPRAASLSSLRSGQFSVLARPPWFVTSRTAERTGEALTHHQATGDVRQLLRGLFHALRG